MKVFEEIKTYIDISVILVIIGFSIKVCINIIYLTFECYTHKKEEEAERNKTEIIDLT